MDETNNNQMTFVRLLLRIADPRGSSNGKNNNTVTSVAHDNVGPGCQRAERHRGPCFIHHRNTFIGKADSFTGNSVSPWKREGAGTYGSQSCRPEN